MAEPAARRIVEVHEPYDFFESTRLLRTGARDPTVRREPDGLWRTAHTDDGPATVHFTLRADGVAVDAWGPGASAALEAAPRWIGLHERPWSLPPHPVTDRWLRQHAGLRGSDTGDVFEALVNVVLQQLVTWNEAAMTWRRLCEGLGEPAPDAPEMRLSPTPAAIRRAGLSRLQSFGIGRQRARTLVEVARVAHAVGRVRSMASTEAAALLERIPGIGPWTSQSVLGMRLGHPDAVPLGDYHLPNMVAWGLAGEARGTEERMLELLEPFAGKRFWVLRLLHAARVEAPRRGPKRGWGSHHRPPRR